MRKFLIHLFLLFIFLQGIAQKSEHLLSHYKNEYQTFKEFIKYSETARGDTNIDVKFYYIDISVGIWSPYIEGDVQIIFEPVTNNLENVAISLNSALTADDVSGNCASFYQEGDLIMITLDGSYNPGEEITITITYHGVPALAGGYKGLRYETHGNNEPIIATLSTPYLAHYWYPCKDGPQDKPDSVYMDITIPDEVVNGQELMAISNGVLESIINNGDTKTFQWRHRYPIVTYYVMAAISNYTFFEEEFNGTLGESFPLIYYVFQESLNSAQAGVADLPEVIQFYSDVFGEYPFSNEKYGMTQLGFYGAIENQTNTIQNNLSTSWFDTSIHELAHMWFGDMITCESWHHGWLNEGFATYSEALWDEHLYGFNAYKSNMAANEYWGGGTLYMQNAADTFNTFASIFYTKGAYIVHMLRGLAGNDLFFDALHDYATDPELMYGNASTEDLQNVFENATGMDLEFFFDQWVYDEYWPFYYYNYFQNTDNGLFFMIYQAQEELYGYRPVFEMPVRLQINFTDGTDTTVTVWNDQQDQQFYFDLNKEVSTVDLDPDKWILRKKQLNPDLPVVIENFEQVDNVRIYPNPFSSELYIELGNTFSKNVKVEISDMNGNLVKNYSQLNSNLVIWTGENENENWVEPGIYFVKIKTDSGIVTKKVVMVGVD
nr:T9SS type A sorting domain-containing protein [Bacteroidota bacterium]